jgi:hypothetical protein
MTTLSEAQMRKRIRYLISVEMRQRISEFPGYLMEEDTGLDTIWQGEVWRAADKIWPEGRKPPGGFASIDTSQAVTSKE